ncbi:MAG: HAD-IA family hydrolase [Muribaculaceae bacterium]|nr:HAD-IA family hydrolase [Muribaculaceae bacterium]
MEISDDIILSFLKRRHYKQLQPIAALIDMDGTLYDSMGNHADAWHRLATELGIPTTREEFFLYEGRTGASTLNLLFNRAYNRDATAQEIEELYARKALYFTQMPAVKPMPGAMQMLNFFKEVNMRRVLVTGSGQRSLIDRLERDFPGAFTSSMMVTSRDVKCGKPHPEPFIKAMEMARVRPSQAIAIENAPLGVKSASAAGAFTVAVTTGPIPREELIKAGAAIVFDSMEQCAEMLPQLVFKMFNLAVD